MLGVSSDSITLNQLETLLPDHFSGKFENSKIKMRLKVEALYQASVRDQQNDIERVELDQSLSVPMDINYTE